MTDTVRLKPAQQLTTPTAAFMSVILQHVILQHAGGLSGSHLQHQRCWLMPHHMRRQLPEAECEWRHRASVSFLASVRCAVLPALARVLPAEWCNERLVTIDS